MSIMSDDLRHVWLDFQQMQEFEKDPLIIESGDGIRVRTTEGRELIDGISGAVVNGVGYQNTRVAEAMKAQVDRLLFWPVLHSTTAPAIALSRRLCELLPGDLDRAFLLSGGSEATEAAMKMARQYHVQTGNPRKQKIIARYGAYHGSTKGALSASGIGDKRVFEPFLSGFVHALPPTCYRCPFGQAGPNFCKLECVEQFDTIIRAEGRDTVAAVIVDPIMAAAGVIVPPEGYYQLLREICDRHDVLLIFDEVLTGFGRLGHWFACEYYDVVPDIVCLGKGIASGFAPLAATVARRHVADAFLGAAEERKQFLHGNTYGGNPLACATGLAVIDELERGGLIGNAADVGGYLGSQLRELATGHDIVGDVRGLGMIWGVEFVDHLDPERPYRSGGPLVPELIRHLLDEEDLITRGSADVLQIAPPLASTEADIDEIVARIRRGLDHVLAGR